MTKEAKSKDKNDSKGVRSTLGKLKDLLCQDHAKAPTQTLAELEEKRDQALPRK